MDPPLLARLPFFSDLSDDEVGAIARSVDEVSVEEGRDIVREGDFSYDVFVIVDGAARVHRDGETIAELRPGDFFGEGGVLGKGLRAASVTTTEPTRLVTLNHWDIQRLRKEIPEVLDRMEQAIEQRNPG
jgi:CRP/FNR family transcriptional regulator, cyclic AMP receptor protein